MVKGNLDQTSIVWLKQNADKIFNKFSIWINKSIIFEKQKLSLMNTLIDDSLFSISRTLCGTMTKEIIDTFEIVIKVNYCVGENYDYRP